MPTARCPGARCAWCNSRRLPPRSMDAACNVVSRSSVDRIGGSCLRGGRGAGCICIGRRRHLRRSVERRPAAAARPARLVAHAGFFDRSCITAYRGRPSAGSALVEVLCRLRHRRGVGRLHDPIRKRRPREHNSQCLRTGCFRCSRAGGRHSILACGRMQGEKDSHHNQQRTLNT